MILGFGSGTSGGLPITITGGETVVGVVWAKAELLSENPPAAIKTRAPIANALRKLFRNLL
jgi:hypothetical protein